MKLHHYLFCGLGTLLSFTACKPEVDTTLQPLPLPPGIEQTGTVTESGQPQGAPISKVIGPEGGTISTADGHVQLSIPAGALTKSTDISIQLITNKNPNGLAQAYRFSPEGLTFRQAATLTFQYDEKKLSSKDVENLGIAYQRSNGIWYDVAGASVNTSKHEINVPIRHFSDWTPYELAQLEFTGIGSSTTSGTEYVPCGKSIDLYAGLLTSNPDYPKDSTEKPLKAKKGFGSNWKLFGEGQLSVDPKASGAKYTAPGLPPVQNPVQVTADLEFENKKFKITLFCQIYVGDGSYFTLTAQNNTKGSSSFSCAQVANQVILEGSVGSYVMMLKVNAKDLHEGYYTYDKCGVDAVNGVQAVYSSITKDGEIPDAYISYYDGDCDGLCHPSPDGLSVDLIETTNGVRYVTGSFVGTCYRRTGVCNKNFKLEKVSVKGSFRMPILKL
ncbi:hypothetical protein IC229_15970 [Spirosoma sp. BT702]|uniref:ZU5 domain-containing protein n=1 Tax=Spirosoma profusum TaxID=2771354 RepID=A0A927ANM2_9BACT|nr:hypothetical protein [Spirosoma profusum]MBD2702149.1 hypothetical protein [Spirosoma profusum]